MTARIQKRLRTRKARIQHRLRSMQWPDQHQPQFANPNISYDLVEKAKGLSAAGLGAVQTLVHRLRLPESLNDNLHLLKRHVPYFESDHILNLTYNFLIGGKTLDDIELRRNDEVYLDVLGAQRIPDPTTAGDFLRRFDAANLDTLMDVINQARLAVWRQQPDSFFEQAIIEADGTMVQTTGQCKQGMDISHDGCWGYHPLLVSLANTQEPLFLFNRPANRPSHEGAAGYFDKAAALCRQAGFGKILFRGDTDFSQTTHLDRWHEQQIGFVFGFDAQPNLVQRAVALPADCWQSLPRSPRYQVLTKPRKRPANVKEQIVQRRGFHNLRLVSEEVAEFWYRPDACCRNYRMVVVRKQLMWQKHGQDIEPETRYYFYITNERDWTGAEVVAFANDRGNQENLIEQLKNGVRALRAPVNTLEANGAWMVIGALAWSVKIWLGLLQPCGTNRARLLVMEFRGFLDEVMRLPCQIVRTGRRLVYRLLQWSPWVDMLCGLVERLRKLCLT